MIYLMGELWGPLNRPISLTSLGDGPSRRDGTGRPCVGRMKEPYERAPLASDRR
jgi:hypothetical protein